MDVSKFIEDENLNMKSPMEGYLITYSQLCDLLERYHQIKINGVLDEMIEYIEETDQQIEWEWGSCRSLQEVKDDNDMPDIYYKLIALKNGG